MSLLFVQLEKYYFLFDMNESYFPEGKINIILGELRRVIHPK